MFRVFNLRFAWPAWHFVTWLTCLATCGKSFFVAGAILSQRFQHMRDMFRGRRSTSDVSCCLFSANGIVRAARSGEQMYFVRMKFGGSFARNIVLEVANLEVLRQIRRKTSISNLASKYQNWRNSRTKCSF